MKDVVFVVKSHQRVSRFFDKTYKQVIVKHGFPLNNLYIFVSTDEDVLLYKHKYQESHVIKAPIGVAAVDNFITSFFKERQKIVYMNDDVTDIMELVNGKLQSVSTDKLHNIINAMFSRMQNNNITYGGFYPVANNLFMMGQKMTYNLCLIMDPFSLVINNKKVIITISDKSDFEKSIQHFVYQGALIRYNHIALKVEYYGKVGGFQGRNQHTEKASAMLMMQKYKNYITAINTKKDGKTSLRLKKIKEQITVQ
jgi:hypothetical protein